MVAYLMFRSCYLLCPRRCGVVSSESERKTDYNRFPSRQRADDTMVANRGFATAIQTSGPEPRLLLYSVFDGSCQRVSCQQLVARRPHAPGRSVTNPSRRPATARHVRSIGAISFPSPTWAGASAVDFDLRFCDRAFGAPAHADDQGTAGGHGAEYEVIAPRGSVHSATSPGLCQRDRPLGQSKTTNGCNIRRCRLTHLPVDYRRKAKHERR